MVPEIREDLIDTWRQVWSIAARSVSQPAISRASCFALKTILEADILPRHALTDDLNGFVVTADINGPAILCDTSLSFMSYLLQERNVRLPNGSQVTSSHIIRWAFLKWNPSELHFLYSGVWHTVT